MGSTSRSGSATHARPCGRCVAPRLGLLSRAFTITSGGDRMRSHVMRAVSLLLALLLLPCLAAADLSPDLQKALTDSKYVYISSTRKDGALSNPAEIWFLYTTAPCTSARARPLGACAASRPAARPPRSPSAASTAPRSSPPAAGQRPREAQMLEAYAKKYPDGLADTRAGVQRRIQGRQPRLGEVRAEVNLLIRRVVECGRARCKRRRQTPINKSTTQRINKLFMQP